MQCTITRIIIWIGHAQPVVAFFLISAGLGCCRSLNVLFKLQRHNSLRTGRCHVVHDNFVIFTRLEEHSQGKCHNSATAGSTTSKMIRHHSFRVKWKFFKVPIPSIVSSNFFWTPTPFRWCWYTYICLETNPLRTGYINRNNSLWGSLGYLDEISCEARLRDSFKIVAIRTQPCVSTGSSYPRIIAWSCGDSELKNDVSS